jgi:hypothetical protein
MHTSQVLMSLWDTETAMSTAGAPFEGTGMDTRPRVPVLNFIIFMLFIGRTDNKGRLEIMKLFSNTKETISDIFSNDD